MTLKISQLLIKCTTNYMAVANTKEKLLPQPHVAATKPAAPLLILVKQTIAAKTNLAASHR